MQVFRLPLLSTFNGPSYLLHAVETLHAYRWPPAKVRLVPIIGDWSGPEVQYDYSQFNMLDLKSLDAERPMARFRINVRADNRLRRLLPLVAVGIPKPQAIAEAIADAQKQSASLNKLYKHQVAQGVPELLALEEAQRQSGAWNTEYLRMLADGRPVSQALAEVQRLSDSWSGVFLLLHQRLDRQDHEGNQDNRWSNLDSPVDRMTRELCHHFPELCAVEHTSDSLYQTVLGAGSSGFKERDRPQFGGGQISESEVETNDEAVRALFELFYTQAFLTVASVDMMGGLAYRLKMGGFGYRQPDWPQEREIDLVISRSSGIHDVVRWIHEYPHKPISPVSYAEFRAGLKKAEYEEWEAYFERHPSHDNVILSAPDLLTAKDPAIIAIFGDIRTKYDKGHTEPLTPDEMLCFARAHLPEYLPDYPKQYAVTGGMNIEGVILNLLMGRWLVDGPFLGMTREDWMQFASNDQVTLCTLLMQRRSMLDQRELLRTAMQLLVHPGVEVFTETYSLQPVRLGKPLSQPGRTLSTDGVVALHAPELVISIPVDYTTDEIAPQLERRIQLLVRLFLPAHLAYKLVWRVAWAQLGRDSYLTPISAIPGGSPAGKLAG